MEGGRVRAEVMMVSEKVAKFAKDKGVDAGLNIHEMLQAMGIATGVLGYSLGKYLIDNKKVKNYDVR